jgi:hypothetical protein
MKRILACCRVSVAAVLAGAVSACDSPGGPDKPDPDLPYSVAIVGPANVPPGQSGSYTADVRRPDGSTAPIGSVIWSSNKPLLLRIDSSGLATAALLHGDAILQAEVRLSGEAGVARGSREVIVQADGTFRLVGRVTEAGTGGFGLHGARVEARLSGDLSAPLVTYATTTPDGAYRLYGVPRDAFIHVWLDGYRSSTTHVQLSEHQTRHFDLEPETPRLRPEGAYTMTVVAQAPSCGPGSAFPDDLTRRTYTATLTPAGTLVHVDLAGATFANLGGRVANRFTARATSSALEVDLPWFYAGGFYYDQSTPDVAELLPNGTILVISGRGSLSGTPSEMSGRLSGSMALYSGELGTFIGGCSPQLTLTRR